MEPAAPRRLFLIDGSGFIFRAFHGLPMMTRPDGTPVNAVYGFITMLLKVLQEMKADHVGVIFDSARKTFRNDIYPEYKAHRPPPPEELIPQFPLIREATCAFNLSAIELEGYEADDLIATYARQAAALGAEVMIVSSDKDLMQLVNERICLFDPLKNRTIGPAEVREKFFVDPDRVIDVQALAGDASDNVPGVPGIGVKTAALLIDEYGDLDTLLARAGEIKQPKRRESLLANADMARLSRQLVTLKDDVPLTVPLSDMAVRAFDPDSVAAFLHSQNFKTLLRRLEGGKIVTTTSAAPAAPSAAASSEIKPFPAAVEARYELVTDEAALERWIARSREAGIIAVDTETTSLDALHCDLVGLSLSVAPGDACYIPTRYRPAGAQGMLDLGGDKTDDTPPILSEALVLERLRPLLNDPGVLKVGQNIKFDLHVLGVRGVTVTPIDDTMVLSYVLDGGAHGHGMDELAKLHLDYETVPYTSVCGTGKNQITFDQVPLDKALHYAAEDADITLRLHTILKKRLVDEKMVSLYEELERPLIAILTEMEQAGIVVDTALLAELSADFEQRMNALEREIHTLAGESFNVNSPKQLGEILFERMSIPGGKKSSKTGAWGTGADVLEALAAQGHDLPARILDWRHLAKLKSTYTDALIAETDPKDHRVHTSFSMTVTTTGRLSSSDPNLQNIPIRTEEGRKIRKAFVAPPGHLLMSADYSQIELRLVAHVAKIEGLKEAFHKGIDIHAVTASQVFGIPLENMDPMVRRRAKAINFGIIYGISAFGLANQLSLPQSEAKRYIEAYFSRYPEILSYMEETKEQARKMGYVTTPFGRKCFTPGISSKNAAVRNFAERAAINAPIQGGAADIIKRAMVELPAALRDAGLSGRLLLQVHDELILEVPQEEVEKTRNLLKSIMEKATHLDVPLIVDVGNAASWADAH